MTHQENNKKTLDDETRFDLLSIHNEKNEHFLMAFTDWNELKKWKGDCEQQTLVLSYEDYQEIIIKKGLSYQGMVINPFGESIVLERQILAETMTNKYVAQKGEKILLGIPEEYPTHIVNKLKEYFSDTKNIDKAYLLWMVRNNEGSYLLVLDSKEPSEQLFPLIGQLCAPLLKDKVLDIVLADSTFGKSAIEEHTPFYEK